MANLPLDTVLALIVAVPAGIAFAKATDRTTKVVCGVLLALAVVAALYKHVDAIRDLLNRNAWRALCGAILGVGIYAAVRLSHVLLGTLIVTGAALLAAIAFGLVG